MQYGVSFAFAKWCLGVVSVPCLNEFDLSGSEMRMRLWCICIKYPSNIPMWKRCLH